MYLSPIYHVVPQSVLPKSDVSMYLNLVGALHLNPMYTSIATHLASLTSLYNFTLQHFYAITEVAMQKKPVLYIPWRKLCQSPNSCTIVTRVIRYKGHPIRDIVCLSEKLRDTTNLRLVCLDVIRDSLEYEMAASEMQGHLPRCYSRC